jgi:hypothetical protein
MSAEDRRLADETDRKANWKRWGPYLSERQWGTVREDYSPDGSAWTYFPHEHARSRAYRWGEDGLFGFTDRQCRLCFALALWNGRDPILKERFFGLGGTEGNHGEDVKEVYFYQDATPTHSYQRALYKYPQAEFPYARLVEENARRGRDEGEFELEDTGIFDGGRYFDVQIEYAKAEPEDVLIRILVSNRGSEAAELAVLPTLWFRNNWSWGRAGEEHGPRPSIRAQGRAELVAEEAGLGESSLVFGPAPDGTPPELLFTENETNAALLWNAPNASPYTKDAFHRYVVLGRADAIQPAHVGTKAAGLYRLRVAAHGEVELRLRLRSMDGNGAAPGLGRAFEKTLALRAEEADEFFAAHIGKGLTGEEARVARAAYAGLLWSKQFYHYVVPQWLEGDPAYPPPPAARKTGRNSEWTHIYNRDLISMPDKWEYPWYAAWDLAFHTLPLARVDPYFAKAQLLLFLREWYMHPSGQIPAYEWALSDVNPPVHAWACWRVYKKSAARGERDLDFLKSCFQKLLLNFTWWVNRKDKSGKHLFAGGFLGLDNIGVFDRSAPLPGGGWLDQADGTAWMAFYCGTMLSIALELACHDRSYEDMASKFFEHYVAIADAMNTLGGTGLWNEEDGFYYDQLHVGEQTIPLRLRSLVGLMPLIAAEVLEQPTLDRLGGFAKRMEWFLRNRSDLARNTGYLESDCAHRKRLLAIPSRARLVRVLRYLLDESEFLSPYGIRSLSRAHGERPYRLELQGSEYEVHYTPGESDMSVFGGNSNWRGPIWFPLNFLLVEALERYHYFYGDELQVELPTGSGKRATLGEVAREISTRLARIFLPDGDGRRPCNGDLHEFARDPHWKDHLLFHEYFHAETGRGLGASHQTGWTALVATLMEGVARSRDGGSKARQAQRTRSAGRRARRRQ